MRSKINIRTMMVLQLSEKEKEGESKRRQEIRAKTRGLKSGTAHCLQLDDVIAMNLDSSLFAHT